MSRSEQDIAPNRPWAGAVGHALASSGRLAKELQNLQSVNEQSEDCPSVPE